MADTVERVPRQRSRPARWIALAVAAVLVAFVVVLATRDPATTRLASSPLVGKPAPPITGEGLTDAAPGPFSLTSHRGRYVLVNFFGTWCTPCLTEHPELVSFARRHAQAGDAAVVSVVVDDAPEDVRRFFAENGGEWPVVEDPGQRTFVDYGVIKLPESFLVDPAGIVVAKISGGVTADELDELLVDLRRRAEGA